MPDPAQKVVRNILDEPIPENSEKALTYAFVSKKTSTSTPASHMEGPREEGHLGGVWPTASSEGSSIHDYQQEILGVFREEQKKRHKQVFYRTPWAIGNYLRAWQMDISKGHSSGVDVRAFVQVSILLVWVLQSYPSAGSKRRIHEVVRLMLPTLSLSPPEGTTAMS